MDAIALKLFCDVVDLGGFTQAAAANSITQSAVSQRLKSLEKRFGTLLLERHGTQLHLTRAGEAVYKTAKRILAEIRAVEEELQAMEGKTEGSVRVGAIYSVGLYELEPFVKQFFARHPEIQVQIEYSRANKIYQDLLTGSIDLGIVAYPHNRPQFRYVPFRKDELVLICSWDHPFSEGESVSLKQLSSQPFVAFQRGTPTRKALDEVLQSHSVSVVIKAEFDNIDLIKRAVEIGLGVSIVPSTTILSEIQAGLFKALALEEGPFMRPIAIVYRRGRPLSPAVKKFIGVLTADHERHLLDPRGASRPELRAGNGK